MKSNVFQLSHRIKTSNQVVPKTKTLEKRVFAVAGSYKGLWVVSFYTKYKHMWYTLASLRLPCISRGKMTKQIMLMRFGLM